MTDKEIKECEFKFEDGFGCVKCAQNFSGLHQENDDCADIPDCDHKQLLATQKKLEELQQKLDKAVEAVKLGLPDMHCDYDYNPQRH